MTTATKWALAVGALALALIVALLPRAQNQPTEPGTDLGPARERAALAACVPEGGADAEDSRAASGAWAEVETLCLGDGSRVALADALGEGPTLVNVWATWCEPCREELPLLAEYAQRPDAARVVTVQVQSSPEDGLGLLTELGVRLPALHDGEGARGPVREALRVPTGLPASYVVEGGEARLVTNPRLFTSVEEIVDAVDSAEGAR
ncbi:TlpA family protein disulfide reductase [Saccharomonospora azurea]|uniref:Thiol-disulfide isomerase-like thioredoxin n=1 Tax=Saccharomonospora azurea NA-128 TaxID=882081 RepID=H8G6H8_9PSEU|nr:TlpA disulfide reductase family protein [Saccharomonospora azurea]EHY89280.1 thiol-disulfide isomerase-like thioredoxin [Saccharomonospora azurea NA-128]